MVPVFLIVYGEMTSIVSFFQNSVCCPSSPSFIIRKCGSNYENDLWDGAPSTRILRWRDDTFSVPVKTQLHEAVRSYCGITLSGTEDERIDPREADEKIIDAFSQVKHFVYHNDPNGTWKKFNAEYGFNRNLLGCKYLWVVLSAVGVVICGICWYFTEDNAYRLDVH